MFALVLHALAALLLAGGVGGFVAPSRGRGFRSRRFPHRGVSEGSAAAIATAAAAAAEVEKGGLMGIPWSEMEDWLVQDAFERFSIDRGRYVLWRRLVREVPELAGRSPEEARARWLELAGDEAQVNVASDQPFYEQPVILEQWEDLGDGTFSGNVVGHPGVADGTLLKTALVDLEGRAGLGDNMYIKTRGGVVYELGSSLLEDGSAVLIGGEILRGAAKGAADIMPMALGTVTGIASILTIGAILTHHLQIEVFIV